MKKKMRTKIIIPIIIIIIVFGIITIWPWWSFVIPVIIYCAITGRQYVKYSFFTMGFLAGFIVWSTLNFGLELTRESLVFNRIAGILGIPRFLLFIGSGLIGGIITGLAAFIGKNLIKENKEVGLNIKVNE